MGDADYTGNQLTLDGQRTGGFLDYWHLVGGPIVFFLVFFFLFRSRPRFICLFLVLLRFFLKSFVSFLWIRTEKPHVYFVIYVLCMECVRCMEWKETGFGPCVDLHKPKQHHGALEQ